MAGFINRLFALPEKLQQMEIIKLSKPVAQGLTTAGTWIFFVVVGIFAVWVLGKYTGNIKLLRGEV
jgi:hypothetical protein